MPPLLIDENLNHRILRGLLRVQKARQNLVYCTKLSLYSEPNHCGSLRRFCSNPRSEISREAKKGAEFSLPRFRSRISAWIAMFRKAARMFRPFTGPARISTGIPRSGGVFMHQASAPTLS